MITEQEDIEDIYKMLESVSLEDKETEPAAGGSETSFRFNLSNGTTYEVVYSSIAVKSGRIMVSDSEKDYFTSADIEAIWNDLPSVQFQPSYIPNDGAETVVADAKE